MLERNMRQTTSAETTPAQMAIREYVNIESSLFQKQCKINRRYVIGAKHTRISFAYSGGFRLSFCLHLDLE